MNAVLYVVITADSDKTVLGIATLRDVLCLYRAKECFSLLRQSFVKDKWVLSRIMDDFTSPSFTLSVFWVSPVGIPKTLGIWVRLYPKLRDTQITVTGTKSHHSRPQSSSLLLGRKLQNKGRSRRTGCNLRPNVCDVVPYDRISSRLLAASPLS